jgi:hypothetical protein
VVKNSSRLAYQTTERENRKHIKSDRLFNKAGQLSQVLLLILGVFGYFYTVLPVYQKSLLDEDIAQKTLELRAKEKQSIALTSEIESKQKDLLEKDRKMVLLTEEVSKKQKDLVEKDRQIGVVKSEVITAKSEALLNYEKLRIEYILKASSKFATCVVSVNDQDLDGSELDKCRNQIARDLKINFPLLHPKDAELFLTLLKIQAQEFAPKYQVHFNGLKSKLETLETNRITIDREVSEFEKIKDDSVMHAVNRSRLNSKLRQIEFESLVTRHETHEQFRKIANEASRKLYLEFIYKVAK